MPITREVFMCLTAFRCILAESLDLRLGRIFPASETNRFSSLALRKSSTFDKRLWARLPSDARFVTGAPTNASQVLLMAQCHLPRSIDLDNRGVMWTFVPIQSLHSSWPRPCSLPQLSPGDCDPHYTTLLSGHRGRPPSSELQ